MTRTSQRPERRGARAVPAPPDAYDPRAYPAFAVTVDVVTLTLRTHAMHVLLVERGEEPFRGRWALPGGFKRPTETLDQAAGREVREETGVEAAPRLRQFGAYGDPGRDPRMNVVTVAYLAVLPDVPTPVGGTDATAAALVPVAEVLEGRRPLAFDHARIVGDAVDRVRLELGLSGMALAFLGEDFTIAELRSVYEAVWGVRLDAANFRRSVAEGAWLVPMGRRTTPGPVGGRPAERYRAGDGWLTGSPIHRWSRTPERRSHT
jgi:8-oxo-dGTP diphosphatase